MIEAILFWLAGSFVGRALGSELIGEGVDALLNAGVSETECINFGYHEFNYSINRCGNRGQVTIIRDMTSESFVDATLEAADDGDPEGVLVSACAYPEAVGQIIDDAVQDMYEFVESGGDEGSLTNVADAELWAAATEYDNHIAELHAKGMTDADIYGADTIATINRLRAGG